MQSALVLAGRWPVLSRAASLPSFNFNAWLEGAGSLLRRRSLTSSRVTYLFIRAEGKSRLTAVAKECFLLDGVQ